MEEEKVEIQNEEIEVQPKKRKKVTLKLLFKLFYTSLYISAVAFGGGFVVLSLLQSVFVKKYKMIEETEMTDLNALAQASPGAIALNTAMLVGFKVAGFLGALTTIIGSIIPPFVIITGLYYFYDAIKGFEIVTLIMKGLQAGVVGVILSMAVDLWKGAFKKKNVTEVVILILAFTACFVSSFVFEISIVIYVVLLSAVLGIGISYISYFYSKKKGGKKDDIS